MNRKKLIRSLIFWALLAPVVIVILFPYAVMTITALKSATEVHDPNWWPHEWRWQNFPEMWESSGFAPALVNSLYVSGLTTLLTLVVSIPAAYAISRFRFVGRGAFRQFLLVSQMLSPIVLVIGLFRLVASLGLIDNLNVLMWIYVAFNIAFCVWMLQSYFSTIPRDLEEAAWMEGAGRWRTLVTVFLPLAVPAIVVTAIFTFINAWNEFVIALTDAAARGELHAADPRVLARGGPLHRRLALCDGGGVSRVRAGRDHLRLAAALSRARARAGAVK